MKIWSRQIACFFHLFRRFEGFPNVERDDRGHSREQARRGKNLVPWIPGERVKSLFKSWLSCWLVVTELFPATQPRVSWCDGPEEFHRPRSDSLSSRQGITARASFVKVICSSSQCWALVLLICRESGDRICVGSAEDDDVDTCLQ
jgi:hypothetical protein